MTFHLKELGYHQRIYQPLKTGRLAAAAANGNLPEGQKLNSMLTGFCVTVLRKWKEFRSDYFIIEEGRAKN